MDRLLILDHNICQEIEGKLKGNQIDIDSFFDYLNADLTQEQIKRVQKTESSNLLGLYKLEKHPIKIINVLFFYDCINALQMICNLAVANKRYDFFYWPMTNFIYYVNEPDFTIDSTDSPYIFTAILRRSLNYRYRSYFKDALIGFIASLSPNMDNICKFYGKFPKDSPIIMFYDAAKDFHDPNEVYERLIADILNKDTKSVLRYLYGYYLFKVLGNLSNNNSNSKTIIIKCFNNIKSHNLEFFTLLLIVINSCFTKNGDYLFQLCKRFEFIKQFWDCKKMKICN